MLIPFTRWYQPIAALMGGLSPIFNLPFTDLGSGAVNTTPTFAAGSGTPTFVRATAGWTTLSTGVFVSVASGTARSFYNPVTLAYAGYLAEGASTNVLLWARDMTNAAWTAGATMTVAQTSTGVDGVSNSASRLTAGAVTATNTITQLITAAASTRTYSCRIKRITGTGPVRLSQNNFASNVEVSAQLVLNEWRLVQFANSVLNAVVGIQIDTNGDVLDVDMNQFEPDARASSPIPTTTVAVTRNADNLKYVAASNAVGATGAVVAEVTMRWTTQMAERDLLVAGAASYLLYGNTNRLVSIYDGTGERTGDEVTGTTTAQKLGSTWGGSTAYTSINGVNSAALTFDGDMGISTNLTVGNDNGAITAWAGTIKDLKIYGVTLTTAQLSALTT